jgi:uncharacterized protein (UPF0332 family)
MQHEFATKASENLQASQALYELGLFNASANRAYYAAFHAAIAVLAQYGITHNENPHEWVQAKFSSELVHRRKVFPVAFASVLQQIQSVRNIADYKPQDVSKTSTERQIRKTTSFIHTIQERLRQ